MLSGTYMIIWTITEIVTECEHDSVTDTNLPGGSTTYFSSSCYHVKGPLISGACAQRSSPIFSLQPMALDQHRVPFMQKDSPLACLSRSWPREGSSSLLSLLGFRMHLDGGVLHFGRPKQHIDRSSGLSAMESEARDAGWRH